MSQVVGLDGQAIVGAPPGADPLESFRKLLVDAESGIIKIGRWVLAYTIDLDRDMESVELLDSGMSIATAMYTLEMAKQRIIDMARERVR